MQNETGHVYAIPIKILYSENKRARVGLRVAHVYIELYKEESLKQDVIMRKLFHGSKHNPWLLWYGTMHPATGIKFARLEAVQDYTWEQLQGYLCMPYQDIEYGEVCMQFLSGAFMRDEAVSSNYNLRPILLTGASYIPAYKLGADADCSEVEYEQLRGNIYLLNDEGAFLSVTGVPYAERNKRWSRGKQLELKQGISRVENREATCRWAKELQQDEEVRQYLYTCARGRIQSNAKWTNTLSDSLVTITLPLTCIEHADFDKQVQVAKLAGSPDMMSMRRFTANYDITYNNIKEAPVILMVPDCVNAVTVHANGAGIVPPLSLRREIKQLRYLLTNDTQVYASKVPKCIGSLSVSSSHAVVLSNRNIASQGYYVADVPISLQQGTVQLRAVFNVNDIRFTNGSDWILPRLFTEDTQRALGQFEFVALKENRQSRILLPMTTEQLTLDCLNSVESCTIALNTAYIKQAAKVDIHYATKQSDATVIVNLQGAHVGTLSVDVHTEDPTQRLHYIAILNGSATTVNLHVCNVDEVYCSIPVNAVNLDTYVNVVDNRTGVINKVVISQTKKVKVRGPLKAQLYFGKAPRSIARRTETMVTFYAETGDLPEVAIVH